MVFFLSNNPVEALNANEPFRPRPTAAPPIRPVIAGIPPPLPPNPLLNHRLRHYPIPKSLSQLLTAVEGAADADQQITRFLQPFLHSFVSRFHSLLWLEEAAAVRVMDSYAIDHTVLEIRAPECRLPRCRGPGGEATFRVNR
jgi:hypothetical protein